VAKYPRLLWNEEKLRDNIRFMNRLFAAAAFPINWTAVSKAVCAHEEIVQTLLEEGVSEIADSRLDNLKRIKSLAPEGRTLLLRLPGLHEVDDVVRYADTSLVSEQITIAALAKAARAAGVRHRTGPLYSAAGQHRLVRDRHQPDLLRRYLAHTGKDGTTARCQTQHRP